MKHARTQLRTAVKDCLTAADVAGGNVRTHTRGLGDDALPVVVIEPETENGIETKGPYPAPRVQVRPMSFSVAVYAKDVGVVRDADGNVTSVEKDADEAADELSAAVEAALLSRTYRLMTKDSNGNPIKLGERDLKLLGTGSVRDPITGERVYGAVHMLFEATLLTEEGNPSNTINR